MVQCMFHFTKVRQYEWKYNLRFILIPLIGIINRKTTEASRHFQKSAKTNCLHRRIRDFYHVRLFKILKAQNKENDAEISKAGSHNKENIQRST